MLLYLKEQIASGGRCAYLDVQLILSEGQGLTSSHSQLPLHQVLPCDALCHRVLHLPWQTLFQYNDDDNSNNNSNDNNYNKKYMIIINNDNNDADD